MKPFLETLAIHLIKTCGEELADHHIIFPNRRAGLFFQRFLALHSKTVTWAPHISAISDFLDEISTLIICDPIELQFNLYDTYSSLLDHQESFDDFYHWGEMIVNDFDDIDKYLVDADLLFRNIADLKSLEEPLAGLEEDQLQFIRQFWTHFLDGDTSPEKQNFLKFWKLLPDLYHLLVERLKLQGMGYQGMQYREIAERIESGSLDGIQGGRIIICGFNALNSCERRLFSWLREQGAQFFWDFDKQYVDDTTMEAGKFIRNNLKLFPQADFPDDFEYAGSNRVIRIFDLPTDTLQAKTIHKILDQEDPAGFKECTDAAVVLCDEELLMPVLMSLPSFISEINITMGYPMKNTLLFGFTEQLMSLQNTIRSKRDQSVQFYYKDVIALLTHSYIRQIEPDSIQALLREITERNMVYVDQEMFGSDLEKMIFKRVTGARAFIGYLRGIFLHILDNLSVMKGQAHHDLDREYIFQLLIRLNRLEELVSSRSEMTTEILIRLLKKILTSLRVPFEGEPLAGLQLMGILETRLLDFRHVIILSLNEEVMPGSFTGRSFIPYSLRAGFNMPTREDMDAIYAYYFYRIIQRADKVDLLFNSKSEGSRTGEMSRYLLQLKFRMGIPVIRPGLEVMTLESAPITINHSEEITGRMMRFTQNHEKSKYLSPSALNTYMDCSLKFYLRYIAGIGESDEVKEEVDAAGFGNLVHECMKILYEEIQDRVTGQITSGKLKYLLESDRAESVLKEVFITCQFKDRKNARIEGRNIIIFQVLLKYLNKIIETDLQIAPFKMVSAEETYQRKILLKAGEADLVVSLGGKIDRVDQKNGILRVIDYKTGDANRNFPSVESIFDSSLKSRNRAAFQTLFYAWLVTEKYSNVQILPGLYIMKELYGSSFEPALQMGPPRQKVTVESFTPLEDAFLEQLKQVLTDMFNTDIPFSQTEVEEQCKYCDYAGICNRSAFD